MDEWTEMIVDSITDSGGRFEDHNITNEGVFHSLSYEVDSRAGDINELTVFFNAKGTPIFIKTECPFRYASDISWESRLEWIPLTCPNERRSK